MASDANKSYNWGILGCGWLGQAACRAMTGQGWTCWGTGRAQDTLDAIAHAGGTPMAWSADSPDSDVPTPELLLVALPPSAGMEAFKWAASRFSGADHTILISSTSVYPGEAGSYVESDAIRRTSPHSGVCLLDLEQLFDPSRTSILRAGGLFGPGRHPKSFLRGQALRDPEGAVNMVHQTDVVRAILHAAAHRLSGPWNVVAPQPVSRAEFYHAAGAVDASPKPDQPLTGRRVLSEALVQSGFQFQHSNAAEAVRTLR